MADQLPVPAKEMLFLLFQHFLAEVTPGRQPAAVTVVAT